jgi:hypothetical protein
LQHRPAAHATSRLPRVELALELKLFGPPNLLRATSATTTHGL